VTAPTAGRGEAEATIDMRRRQRRRRKSSGRAVAEGNTELAFVDIHGLRGMNRHASRVAHALGQNTALVRTKGWCDPSLPTLSRFLAPSSSNVE
jgi:hypothetical protein